MHPQLHDGLNCESKGWKQEKDKECGVHSLTFFSTPKSMKCDSRASLLACPYLQALALIINPRLGLRQAQLNW
jgi:hypothetical protein